MASWNLFCHTIVLLFQVRSIAGNSLNIDLAILLFGQVQTRPETQWIMKEALSDQLPTAFPIGETKTRMAIVASVNGSAIDGKNTKTVPGAWHVYTKLTTVSMLKSALHKVLLQKDRRTNDDLSGALNLVRTRIFVEPPERPRVLLIISYNGTINASAQEEGKLLRDSGVFVFVICENGIKNASVNAVAQLAGGIRYIQMFPLDFVMKQNLLKRFKNETIATMCTYKQQCFYNKRSGQCERGWYTPLVPITVGDCNALGLSPNKSAPVLCSDEECTKVCDDLWPWKNVSCSGSDRKIDVRRISDQPWKQCETCPRKYFHKCCTSNEQCSSSSIGMICAVAILIALIGTLGVATWLQYRKVSKIRKRMSIHTGKKQYSWPKKKAVIPKTSRRDDNSVALTSSMIQSPLQKMKISKRSAMEPEKRTVSDRGLEKMNFEKTSDILKKSSMAVGTSMVSVIQEKGTATVMIPAKKAVQ